MSSSDIAGIFGNGLNFAQDIASTPPKAEGGGSKKGGGKAQAHTFILNHNQGPSNIPTMKFEEMKESFKAARKSDGIHGFIPPTIPPERLQRMNNPTEFVERSLVIFHRATVQFFGRETIQNFKGE
jgi:hypothetical protein